MLEVDALDPAAVSAATRKRYSLPLVNPETSAAVPGVPVEAMTVVQLTPPFVD